MRVAATYVCALSWLAAPTACSFDGVTPGGDDVDSGSADAPAALPDANSTDAPPAQSRTLIFQEGDTYVGTLDTYAMESFSGSTFGGDSVIAIDGASGVANFGGEVYGFLRFDDIFGEGLDRIPQTAVIESAILSIVVSKNGSNDGRFREALVRWDESWTWSSYSGGAGPTEGADFDNTDLATLPNQEGTYDIDVRASIAVWTLNPSLANGWVIIPGGNTAVFLRSSNHDNTAERPRLTVTFLDR